MISEHWTSYTIRIVGPRAKEFPELGRWKDRDSEGLVFIRFPGGDGAWFAPGEWVDVEKGVSLDATFTVRVLDEQCARALGVPDD